MSVARKPLPWWQIPAIVAGSLAALTALGTGVVKLAGFLTLQERVEAGEQKNAEQDEVLNKLTGIQETWQQIYQQQQAPAGLREWDDAAQTFWCCDLADRQACFAQQRWRRC